MPVWFLVVNSDELVELGECPANGLEYYKHVDCLPEVRDEHTEELCVARGCYFDATADPACSFSPEFGYSIEETVEVEERVFESKLSAVNPSPVVDKESFDKGTLKTSILSKTIGRLELLPSDDERWRVPFTHPQKESIQSPDYSISTCQTGTNHAGVSVIYQGNCNFFVSIM